jgi:hypothetical protein
MKSLICMENHAAASMDLRALKMLQLYFREKFSDTASRHHPFGEGGRILSGENIICVIVPKMVLGACKTLER